MKNFDSFIGIDWSGAKQPVNTKAIAVAMCVRGDDAPTLVSGPWSRQRVAEWLVKKARGDKRILVGIDCNFGYAQSVGEKQFGENYEYQDLWRAVDAANENTPNYFAGGYWTHRVHKKYFWTDGKMPGGFTMPKRLTETTCGEAGYGWPESPFKLIGAKQVGKGGLAGMRMAADLKKKLGDRIAVWPFEMDLSEECAQIVITEIYPRQFLRRTGHGNAKLHDYKALNASLQSLKSRVIRAQGFLSDHDGDALVSAAGLRYLCGSALQVPERIACPPMLDRQRAQREGWIFGVGDT